tara:strand:- start:1442 stop:1765 length:324 start_codon:yes stop_codon:yes gene_type:complete
MTKNKIDAGLIALELDFQKDEIQNMTWMRFLEILEENTDRNFHSENVLYLAYRSENNDLINRAEKMWLDHMKHGSLTFENAEIRSKISDEARNIFVPKYNTTISSWV